MPIRKSKVGGNTPGANKRQSVYQNVIFIISSAPVVELIQIGGKQDEDLSLGPQDLQANLGRMRQLAVRVVVKVTILLITMISKIF